MGTSLEVRLARPGDDLARAEHGQIVLALLEGRIVGCLTFVPDRSSEMSDFDDPDVAAVRMFGVDSAAQGHGVGRAMMGWCIDEARRLGRRRVGLHTIGIMHNAIRLYTSLGFERDPSLDADFDGVAGLAYVLRL